MEPLEKLLSDRTAPATLSPAWDISRPDCTILRSAEAYHDLFSGVFMKRSPARVSRRGLFQEFLSNASMLKLEDDAVRGFDISVVPYPLRFDLRAWGIVLHPTGRILSVRDGDEGRLELVYQAGNCRSREDWNVLVGKRLPDESSGVRRFYSRVRRMNGGRLSLAGTVGFGLWDALWMSFDFERACRLLTEDREFVDEVFRHWQHFHLSAVAGMLDAGVRLILFRENPAGFPPSRGMADRLDSHLGDHLRELCEAVHSRGGCMFLDCDADEVLETEYPLNWGFDAVGPLLFRDEDDLWAARRSMSEELFLVGTMECSRSPRPWSPDSELVRRLIVTNPPDRPSEQAAGETVCASDESSSHLWQSIGIAS